MNKKNSIPYSRYHSDQITISNHFDFLINNLTLDRFLPSSVLSGMFAAFGAIERESTKMGLAVNEGKTKVYVLDKQRRAAYCFSDYGR